MEPYGRIQSVGRGAFDAYFKGRAVGRNVDMSTAFRRVLAAERVYEDGIECCAMTELAKRELTEAGIDVEGLKTAFKHRAVGCSFSPDKFNQKG